MIRAALVLMLLATPALADGGLEEDQILLLIDRLGSKEFAAREEATKKLIAIGQPAVKLLKESMNDEDLEIRWRVRKILIALGALVDPKVLGEVKKQMAIAVDETKGLPAREAARQRILSHGDQALAASAAPAQDSSAGQCTRSARCSKRPGHPGWCDKKRLPA